MSAGARGQALHALSPQTCDKVERLHQALKRYLRQQAPAHSLAQLQLQLGTFRQYCNQQRPHRALARQTPLVVFNARLKARPSQPEAPTHYRVVATESTLRALSPCVT